MIAGEFSVLVPNQRIIVMAVDRFVYTTVQPSVTNRLTLENFHLHHITWAYTDGKAVVQSTRKEKDYVENALTTAYTYLNEIAVPVEPIHITVRSELDDTSGVKYGLGSSAAVVTSVITAILKTFLSTQPSKTLIFKLAAITHVKTQGNGSGADIAASTFGGVLAYASFQAEWLKRAINTTHTLMELLEKSWIYLEISPVQMPANAYVCIGWTGNPASTSQLVNRVLALKETDPEAFDQFLGNSNKAVTAFLRGVEKADISELLHSVKQNRSALANVGVAAKTDIETPLLSILCNLAERHGGAGKPSGAGGGDCGIAFLSSKEQILSLQNAWEAEGIKPLALAISLAGVSEIE